MRRFLVSGAGVVLLLGVVGCGGSGIDEGMPKGDLKPGAPLDPNMTDPAGRFGAAAANKAAAKNETAAPTAPAPDAGAEKK
jgi:hypothetical protein